MERMNNDEISEVGRNDRKARIRGNERIVRKVVREQMMSRIKKMEAGKAALRMVLLY